MLRLPLVVCSGCFGWFGFVDFLVECGVVYKFIGWLLGMGLFWVVGGLAFVVWRGVVVSCVFGFGFGVIACWVRSVLDLVFRFSGVFVLTGADV